MYQRSYSVINRRRSLWVDQQLVKFINIFFHVLVRIATFEILCYVCDVIKHFPVLFQKQIHFRHSFIFYLFLPILQHAIASKKILQNEMFLLCHPRGKQVTLNFSSVVTCAICEKKIIIKKLHFLNMLFFNV
jgi:hypothetical protein